MTFILLDFALLIAKLIISKEQPNQKRGCPSKGANKRDKKKIQAVINNSALCGPRYECIALAIDLETAYFYFQSVFSFLLCFFS